MVDTQVLQRAAVVTLWSRERGREASVVTDEDGVRHEFRDIKVERGVLQAIDPTSEDIIKAPRLGNSNFTIEVGDQDGPIDASDSGSTVEDARIYNVQDRYNRINYTAHVKRDGVKLVNESNKQETEFSVY